jgi:hypothetical protein
MPELEPHPLVVKVARRLGAKGHPALKPLAENVAARPSPAARNALATELANQADNPELKLISGLLGGPIVRDRQTWRLVYLDSLLSTWLLVPEGEITAFERRSDNNAPSGQRDMLWINRTAPVVHGSGLGPNAQRFLVGEFTRAADFAPETRGGTFSAASGLICEAMTPNCYCLSPRTRT